MKKSSNLDRASLLKAGGTAALAALLAGSLEGQAEACCSPIDLIYTDDPVGTTGGIQKTALRKKATHHATTGIKGIRLWSPHDHPYKAPPGPPWQALFTIATAHASGNDENQRQGNPNPNHGNPDHPTPLGYPITVYVVY